jgi:hypothetical protein
MFRHLNYARRGDGRPWLRVRVETPNTPICSTKILSSPACSTVTRMLCNTMTWSNPSRVPRFVALNSRTIRLVVLQTEVIQLRVPWCVVLILGVFWLVVLDPWILQRAILYVGIWITWQGWSHRLARSINMISPLHPPRDVNNVLAIYWSSLIKFGCREFWLQNTTAWGVVVAWDWAREGMETRSQLMWKMVVPCRSQRQNRLSALGVIKLPRSEMRPLF